MGIIPPARVLAKDLTRASLQEGSPNMLQMSLSVIGRQVTSESMDSHNTGGPSGAKGNQSASS